jgi:hypothetical protein
VSAIIIRRNDDRLIHACARQASINGNSGDLRNWPWLNSTALWLGDRRTRQPLLVGGAVANRLPRLGKSDPALPVQPKQRHTRPHLFEAAAGIAPLQHGADASGDLAAMDSFFLAIINNLSYNAQRFLSKGSAADLRR